MTSPHANRIRNLALALSTVATMVVATMAAAQSPETTTVRPAGEARLAVVHDPNNDATLIGGALLSPTSCGSRARAHLRRVEADGTVAWHRDDLTALALDDLDPRHVLMSALHDVTRDPVRGDLLAAVDLRLGWWDEDAGRAAHDDVSAVLRLDADGEPTARALLGARPAGAPLDDLQRCAQGAIPSKSIATRHRIAVLDDGRVALTRWSLDPSESTSERRASTRTLHLTSDLVPSLEKAVEMPSPPVCLGQHSGLRTILPHTSATIHVSGDRVDTLAPDDCSYVVRRDESADLSLPTEAYGVEMHFEVDPGAQKLTFPIRLKHNGGKIEAIAKLKRRGVPGWQEIGKVVSTNDGWIDDRVSLTTDSAGDFILSPGHAGGTHPDDNVHMRLIFRELVHSGMAGGGNCETTRIDHCDCESE